MKNNLRESLLLDKMPTVQHLNMENISSTLILTSLLTMQVAPCANDTRVDFSWAVTCSDASAKKRVEFSAAFNATRYQSTLKITKGLLTGEVNCTFTVTVRMKYNPSVKTSMSQVIKALPSPLEAAILGGKNNFVTSRK